MLDHGGQYAISISAGDIVGFAENFLQDQCIPENDGVIDHSQEPEHLLLVLYRLFADKILQSLHLAGKLVPMLPPGGKGADKVPQVHVHSILQRIAGLFQLAEFYEPLGGWVMGLGQQVIQEDGRLGGSRLNRGQYPQDVPPTLVNYLRLDLCAANVLVGLLLVAPPQFQLPAAYAMVELNVEQAGQTKNQMGFAGTVADIDDVFLPVAALQGADQHMDRLGYVAKQGLGEQADTVCGHVGVNLGGFQGLVAQHFLQMPHRSSVFEHMGGAGVPEGVRDDVFLMPAR